MTVTITATKRTREIIVSVENLKQAHAAGIEQAWHDVGAAVVRETARLVRNGPKTGRKYGSHQASAPGEAPASRTGKLAESGDYEVGSWLEMTVGETAEYAYYLEHGTKGKIAPRPHLIRAINAQARDTVNSILDGIQSEVRI